MQGAEPQSLGLLPSQDGYLRLTIGGLLATSLRHVFSDLDFETATTQHSTGASATTVVGFTEWASNTLAAVSLGWDWRLDTSGIRPRYLREGDVRSNIMLI